MTRSAGTRGPSLEAFMARLAEIVPGRRISPESELTEDLGFDALAFNRLAVMLYERQTRGC